MVFSLLFALVLSSPVELLHRVGVPRSLGATLILIAFIGIVGGTLSIVWGPARAWIGAIPHTIEVVEGKLGPAARVLEHVFGAVKLDVHAQSAGTSAAEDLAMNASGTLLGEVPSVAVNAVTIMMLTLFLLTGGAPMAARLAATLTSEGKSIKVLNVVGAMRSDVARYYATLAMINLGLGAATAGATILLSLPNPLLWGTVATLLNFIPYAGSAVTLVVLTLVSFVTFDSLGHVVLVAASFLVLVTIEGQIVEPLLIGRRLKLSPIAVFLALWFGGWFWGVAGVVLAIPLLVALKVVAEHSRNGKIFVDLLSPMPRKRHRFLRLKSNGDAAAS
jgi:predicted PurR-regulated permease PerM